MTVTTGPVFVTGPQTRDRYGLFAVAQMEDIPAHAALGGVQWITGNCGLGIGYQVDCAVSLAAKNFTGSNLVDVATPFIVYAARTCGTVGFTAAEQQALTLQKLKASEQAVVESVFSEQLFGQSPGLANNADVVTVPAGTNFVDSIAKLEEAFYAAYGQAGVLHLPFRSGEHASSYNLFTADAEHPMPGNSNVWRTALGSMASIGNYSGKSPVGAAPAAGHQWLYMTSPVKIWRQPDSAVTVSPLEGALNRTTNQETWLAERFYVAGYECNAVFAIDATLPTTTTT